MRKSLFVHSIVLVIAFLAASRAFAIDIIHDSGEALPSAQYLAHLFTVDTDNPASSPTGLQIVSFPVRTVSMKPGVLDAPRTVHKPEWLVNPVFLIGSDPTSRAWLSANLTHLQQIHALGIVVDADDYMVFRALQQIAVGLALAPASVDDVTQSLGVNVYPVLLQLNGEIVQ